MSGTPSNEEARPKANVMRVFVKVYRTDGGPPTEAVVLPCKDLSKPVATIVEGALQQLLDVKNGSELLSPGVNTGLELDISDMKLDDSSTTVVADPPSSSSNHGSTSSEKTKGAFQFVSSGSSCRIVLEGSGARLRAQDAIGDVLRDGDYLCLYPVGQHHEGLDPGGGGELLHVQNYAFFGRQLSVKKKDAPWIELDGCSLTVEDLVKIGRGDYRVKLTEKVLQVVAKSRKVVEDVLTSGTVVYGINTGFGNFAHVQIPADKLQELQESLIRSHAAGVGPSLPPWQLRMLLALRINVLAKGCSGISVATLQQLLDALNASCLSYVPEKGTVGASGDLAPLSHLALGLMGEGHMWSPRTHWTTAEEVLKVNELKPIQLKPKEGLALINGTQLITSLGAEALHRASLSARQADVIAALSIDVLQGTPRAFDQDIHNNRPHPGQNQVAANLRALLDSNVHPSEIREGHKNCHKVQDPYTMRCVPQVHGIVVDTIEFVSRVITTEMNSATDNPMILSERGETISGGNFHGEYPAKVLDYLAIGVHELASMSERRLERMINPAYSNLPAFLVKDGGLNSGFMLAQCTSAALVSENKVLTHPASVDSISTSAGTEDHVSMGGYAARKALTVVEHVETVLAIELMAACQALEFHRPKKTTAPLEEVYRLVRTVVKPWDKDRYMSSDIEAVVQLVRNGKVIEVVEPYLKAYHHKA